MFFKIIILLTLLLNVSCFVPASFISDVIAKMDGKYLNSLGKVNETIVHDEILRRGLIQSIVEYFYAQPNGTNKVNMSKIDNVYYDLKSLYYDYYGVWYCNLAVENLIKEVFQVEVAFVDFNPSTKDMPYAHFDAERFNDSNQRVVNFTNNIYKSLNNSDYTTARSLSGQILHTIQDFYSHSNWVEMGNLLINTLIGTSDFGKQKMASLEESNECVSNCSLISENCTAFGSIFSQLMNAVGYNGSLIKCPVNYYKCSNNVLIMDKLVSGYYVNQKLPDGTPVDKPVNKGKCSHGGVLDSSSFQEAKGGINKDSGYYIISPHADLHLKAAQLAIAHTKYFFGQIRSKYGDKKFAEFLNLNTMNNSVNYAQRQLCNASLVKFNFILFTIIFCAINFLLSWVLV